MRSERRVRPNLLTSGPSAAFAALDRRRWWRRRRRRRRSRLLDRRRRQHRRRWRRCVGRMAEALANCQADHARLADEIAEAGTQAALTVDRQLRVRVEQILDVELDFKTVVP